MINSEYRNGEGDKLPRVASYTRDFFSLPLSNVISAVRTAAGSKDPSVLRGWIKFSCTHTRVHLLRRTRAGLEEG